MSQADVDVVLDQFAAVNEGDFLRAMSHYADDVVLVVPHVGLKGGRFEGKEEVGEWFGEWFRTFAPDYHFEIDEAREIGDLILIHAEHSGHGKASGVEVRSETTYLYGVHDGKVAHVEFYWDRDEALVAAGLLE